MDMAVHDLDRRTFVATTGTAVATLLAGCSGGGAESNDAGGEDNDDDGGGYLDDEPGYGEWFDDVSNYEGTLDRTGQDDVTVKVGAGDGLQFDPPAIAISPGTTVTWEWVGQGGQHNVAAEKGEFESELIDEEGHTFEYTFEEAGVFKYQCDPHVTIGMKGAFVVQ